MKKISRSLLAVLAVLGIVAAMAMPAGATVEQLTWLNVNSPGSCAYSSGTTNGAKPLPGSDYYVSSGNAYFNAHNPCTPGTPYKNLPANYTAVQVQLRCHYTVAGVYQPEVVVWTGNLNYSPAGSANASGGLPWSSYGTTYPYCISIDGGTAQLRTIVKAYYFIGLNYFEYDNTTHWITQSGV